MKVSLIVALARNGVIGTGDGGIPWHLPRDTEHFRSFTAGKWMLLGRRTYLEMQGWFKTQTPVVLTRSRELEVPEGFRVATVEEAVELARDRAVPELVVSGGGSVYEAALPSVDELVLTRIDADIDGGVKFPPLDLEKDWVLEREERWDADEANPLSMAFQTWRRRH